MDPSHKFDGAFADEFEDALFSELFSESAYRIEISCYEGTMNTINTTAKNWAERAAEAGLRYLETFESGITRKKCGKGFKYISHDGLSISCKVTRERIKGLVIPPAWKDVWICPDADGHIQATGFDEAGRKQYIYHARWHQVSAIYKYSRLQLFAGLLPKIRTQVSKDLKCRDLTKRRVIAAVVRLLDKASIRVGNKKYVESNDSHGATTLTAEHVARHSDTIKLNFKGKSGQKVELQCRDEGLASVIEDCENASGQFLFSYLNDDGETVPVTSTDVNAYLLEISGEPITAKDFRTWRGSVISLSKLAEMQDDLSKTAKKRFIVNAVRAASSALGNTLSVCRQSYIHSAILAHAENGSLTKMVREVESQISPIRNLSKDEIRLGLLLPQLDNALTLVSISKKTVKIKKSTTKRIKRTKNRKMAA